MKTWPRKNQAEILPQAGTPRTLLIQPSVVGGFIEGAMPGKAAGLTEHQRHCRR
jgi:hypothetical protein